MAYERINWQNGEVGNTPLNANNLNRMDMAIEEHDQKIGDHDYEIENLKTGAQGITEELNKKMDRINPQGSGTFSIPAVNTDNINAQVVEADEIKVTKVGSKGGTAPVVFDNDILVNGITTPIGSLASSASAKAESAERIANEADREAGTAKTTASTAYSRVQENIFRTDKLEGIVGGGVGESIPQYTYYDGKYLRPDGEIANYNDSARVIEFEINKNSDSGCNVIFKNVDLIPTEFSILCGFYNAAGILLSEEMRGLIVTTDFDEDTGKMTRHYISYCVVPAPYYAKYVRISGIANGAVDIAIQNTLSDAVAELQSRSTSALVLTNPSPLPATDGKKILGIDTKGKSEQDAVNINNDGISNKNISADGNTYTAFDGYFSIANPINVASSSVVTIETDAKPTSGNNLKVFIGEWKTDGTWKERIQEGSMGVGTSHNITIPSDVTKIYIFLFADNVAISGTYLNVIVTTPTPTNPIPITDANPEVTAHTKNMFDPHYGIHSTSTGFGFYANTVGCSDKLLPCVPGEKYKLSMDEWYGSTRWVGYYDGDGNMIVREPNPTVITIPSGAKYFFVSVYAGNITETNYPGHIQLEKGEIATDYVPYGSNSVSLPFEPKSVGSVANELIVNEDGSGKLIRRVGVITFNGTESWQFASATTNRVYVTNAPLGNASSGSASSNMAKFGGIINAGSEISNAPLNQFYLNVSTTESYLWVTTDLTSADAWKSILQSNNMVIYYPLATPIETPLTAEEVASIRQLQTYKGTTIIESEMDVVSVTYSGDIKAYIDYRIDQIINPTALNEVAPMNLDETEE